MPNPFRMTVRAGRFDTNVKRLVDQHCDAGIKLAALDIIAGELATTPIVTGRLRMGWDNTQPTWHGSVRRIAVINKTPYARIVDARSRRNRGYIGRGIAKGKGAARTHLSQAAQALAPHLWVKAK